MHCIPTSRDVLFVDRTKSICALAHDFRDAIRTFPLWSQFAVSRIRRVLEGFPQDLIANLECLDPNVLVITSGDLLLIFDHATSSFFSNLVDGVEAVG